MSVWFSRKSLQKILELADETDTTWFRPRKVLWNRIKRESRHAKQDEDDIEVDRTIWISIKTSLLTRNPSEDQRLAFETGIAELWAKIELSRDEADEDGGHDE
jgi:hypothetical protein